MLDRLWKVRKDDRGLDLLDAGKNAPLPLASVTKPEGGEERAGMPRIFRLST